MGRSVLLLVNTDKPDVVAAAPEVRSLIERYGRIVAELEADNTQLHERQAAGADLIVVLGGDGTLIAQMRRCVGLGLPMLGVKLGRLGFVAEFDLPDLRAQAADLFNGRPLVVQDRPMLRVLVNGADGRADHSPLESLSPDAGAPSLSAGSLALNDAVITAGPPYRMIALTMSIDGQPGPQVAGDGLIVATPMGSTAYNVSAGGPIISPEVSAMVVTPIAPHSLSFRPVVVPGSGTIELTLDRVNDQPDLDGPAGGTCLVLDGQMALRLHAGQKVIIRQHSRHAHFVRNPRSSYWRTLIDKMRWGAPLVPHT